MIEECSPEDLQPQDYVYLPPKIVEEGKDTTTYVERHVRFLSRTEYTYIFADPYLCWLSYYRALNTMPDKLYVMDKETWYFSKDTIKNSPVDVLSPKLYPYPVPTLKLLTI